MNRIKAAIIGACLALLATIGVTASTTTAANAGWFTEITHAKDDSGYSAPIYIQCHDGRVFSLLKGQWSGAFCGARTDYMYVSPGMKIRCLNLFPPFGWRTYDTTGWKYIEGGTQLKCYVQER